MAPSTSNDSSLGAPHVSAPSLPTVSECPRVVIHQFDSSSGFGSEFNILLRISSLASRFGAPVIANSTGWIYGDLSHYFLPPILPSSYPYNCDLPIDVAHLAAYSTPHKNATSPRHTKFSELHWENATRLDVTRSPWRQFPLQDQLVREAHFNMDELAALKLKEHWYSINYSRRTLPYGESIPAELYKVFMAQVAVINQYWRPTPAMQAQIQRLARRVDLDPETFRSTAGRRPVVVVQIRLGDKRLEQTDIVKAGSHMKYDDLDAYYEACRLALIRLATPHYPPIIPPNVSSTRVEAPATRRQRPLLVVMSAEAEVLDRIRALDAAATGMFTGETGGVFDVVQSPSFELSPEHEREYVKMFGAINGKVYRPSDPEPSELVPTAEATISHGMRHTLESRWSQNQLKKVSLGLRLALSRQLIAELTVYSRMAGAFVVSGNSNLGRLALLLGGVEGSLGYGVSEDLIRSVDVPWFPTAYRKGIFGGYSKGG
ncbi:hypothetical protein BKA62DRAFT_627755 [Auriculariales sp. MPI-PUGE-AT-0066]|nr:hypothetical protein BKA62DRAFT_627755 [Auriculariales sp. MPI-PUGE-AT-0066]